MIVHPEVGKWLIAARGEDPSGWIPSAGGSLPAVVGALMVLVMMPCLRAASPARPRSASSPACLLSPRRAATSCCPGSHCSTSSPRSGSCSAACTASSPTATGTAARAGLPPSKDHQPDRALGGRSAACSSGRGCCSAASAGVSPAGSKWEAIYPLAGVRPLPRPVGFPARRLLLGLRFAGRSGVGVSTASRRSSNLVTGGPGRLRRDLDRLADAREPVRGAPVGDAVHPTTPADRTGRRGPSRTPTASVR